MKYKDIRNFSQRCEEHPDHQSGMISHQMLLDRAHEEIDELREYIEQAQKPEGHQEPGACSACFEVHAVLDADESKIIRDAKDGYLEGRKPRVLTLAERVSALCIYAADWKRWCLEKEATPPQRQPLTDEEIE